MYFIVLFRYLPTYVQQMMAESAVCTYVAMLHIHIVRE